ncbi:hypothetical protein FOA52_001103 [Chlamydomonas sp. UWO 241]|nr:hypothetical protein FOA52_001103 [Chlamydomonas sp. UWO 241]
MFSSAETWGGFGSRVPTADQSRTASMNGGITKHPDGLNEADRLGVLVVSNIEATVHGVHATLGQMHAGNVVVHASTAAKLVSTLTEIRQAHHPLNMLLVHADIARSLAPLLLDLSLPVYLLACASPALGRELKCSGVFAGPTDTTPLSTDDLSGVLLACQRVVLGRIEGSKLHAVEAPAPAVAARAAQPISVDDLLARAEEEVRKAAAARAAAEAVVAGAALTAVVASSVAAEAPKRVPEIEPASRASSALEGPLVDSHQSLIMQLASARLQSLQGGSRTAAPTAAVPATLPVAPTRTVSDPETELLLVKAQMRLAQLSPPSSAAAAAVASEPDRRQSLERLVAEVRDLRVAAERQEAAARAQAAVQAQVQAQGITPSRLSIQMLQAEVLALQRQAREALATPAPVSAPALAPAVAVEPKYPGAAVAMPADEAVAAAAEEALADEPAAAAESAVEQAVVVEALPTVVVEAPPISDIGEEAITVESGKEAITVESGEEAMTVEGGEETEEKAEETEEKAEENQAVHAESLTASKSVAAEIATLEAAAAAAEAEWLAAEAEEAAAEAEAEAAAAAAAADLECAAAESAGIEEAELGAKAATKLPVGTPATANVSVVEEAAAEAESLAAAESALGIEELELVADEEAQPPVTEAAAEPAVDAPATDGGCISMAVAVAVAAERERLKADLVEMFAAERRASLQLAREHNPVDSVRGTELVADTAEKEPVVVVDAPAADGALGTSAIEAPASAIFEQEEAEFMDAVASRRASIMLDRMDADRGEAAAGEAVAAEEQPLVVPTAHDTAIEEPAVEEDGAWKEPASVDEEQEVEAELSFGLDAFDGPSTPQPPTACDDDDASAFALAVAAKQAEAVHCGAADDGDDEEMIGAYLRTVSCVRASIDLIPGFHGMLDEKQFVRSITEHCCQLLGTPPAAVQDGPATP